MVLCGVCHAQAQRDFQYVLFFLLCINTVASQHPCVVHVPFVCPCLFLRCTVHHGVVMSEAEVGIFTCSGARKQNMCQLGLCFG